VDFSHGFHRWINCAAQVFSSLGQGRASPLHARARGDEATGRLSGLYSKITLTFQRIELTDLDTGISVSHDWESRV